MPLHIDGEIFASALLEYMNDNKETILRGISKKILDEALKLKGGVINELQNRIKDIESAGETNNRLTR